jgi:hypothetical protein
MTLEQLNAEKQRLLDFQKQQQQIHADTVATVAKLAQQATTDEDKARLADHARQVTADGEALLSKIATHVSAQVAAIDKQIAAL